MVMVGVALAVRFATDGSSGSHAWVVASLTAVLDVDDGPGRSHRPAFADSPYTRWFWDEGNGYRPASGTVGTTAGLRASS